MFIGSYGQAGGPFIFCIERSKDAAGNDTGAGIIAVYCHGTTAAGCLDGSWYMNWALGSQASPEFALAYIITSKNPSESFGGEIGVGVVIPMRGLAMQPGVNVLIVNSSDVGIEGSFSSILYGTAHTYQQCNFFTPGKSVINNSVSSASESTCRVAVRFD